MKKIITVIIITIIAILLISSAKVVDEREGYKIKVIKDTIEGNGTEESIVFVSPEGEIIKRMKKYRWDKDMSVEKKGERYEVISKNVEAITEDSNRILISEQEMELDYDPRGIEGSPADKYKYKVIVINERGEEIFKKSVLGYNDKLMGNANIRSLISRDGERVCIFYMDSTNTYHIEVYNIEGEKIVEAKTKKIFAYTIELSADGSIFGGTIYEEGKKYLYFLNVDTGEEKICKAEGEGWECQYSLPPEGGTPLGKVSIRWGIYEDPDNKKWVKGGHKYLTFNEIPEDLSVLFQQEGDQ